MRISNNACGGIDAEGTGGGLCDDCDRRCVDGSIAIRVVRENTDWNVGTNDYGRGIVVSDGRDIYDFARSVGIEI